MKKTIYLSLLCLPFLITSCFRNEPPPPEPFCGVKDPEFEVMETKNQPFVFKAKCAVCHMKDKHTTGPKLVGIFERIPNEQWFENFVRNEDSLEKIKDPYTLQIQKWSVVDGNHGFDELTEDEMRNLKSFIKRK